MESTPNSPLQRQVAQTREDIGFVRNEVSLIGAELAELVRLEAELAGAEMNEARAHASKGATFGGAVAIFGLVTAFFLFLTIMFVLDEFLPLWAAAAITAALAGLLAFVTMRMASSEFKLFSPTPKRFIKSVQEDVQWAKTQMKSSGR
jgi:hypothetical protein